MIGESYENPDQFPFDADFEPHAVSFLAKLKANHGPFLIAVAKLHLASIKMRQALRNTEMDQSLYEPACQLDDAVHEMDEAISGIIAGGGQS